MLNAPQNDARRASEVLYDEVENSRNGPRRENIRLLRKVCDQMEKDNVQMSMAEVVRRAAEFNGPAYSTVSNAGSKLGEYVQLRIVEQGARVTKRMGQQSLADSVTDPVLQAQIRDKEDTARWVGHENNGLRNLLKSLRPGIDVDGMLQRGITELKPPEPPKLELSQVDPEASAAILKLLTHLIGSRNYIELRGRLTINAKVVLDASEYSALRKATGISEEDWPKRFGSAA